MSVGGGQRGQRKRKHPGFPAPQHRRRVITRRRGCLRCHRLQGGQSVFPEFDVTGQAQNGLLPPACVKKEVSRAAEAGEGHPLTVSGGGVQGLCLGLGPPVLSGTCSELGNCTEMTPVRSRPPKSSSEGRGSRETVLLGRPGPMASRRRDPGGGGGRGGGRLQLGRRSRIYSTLARTWELYTPPSTSSWSHRRVHPKQ